jgi:phage-related protein
MIAVNLKPVEWTGSCRKDLREFPEPVRRKVGYALYRAQEGKTSADAKLMKGLGPGVVEIVADHGRNAYRAVYTVRFARAIYVLHVFQKKSKTGTATPKQEIDLIRRRLTTAAEHYRNAYGREPNDAQSANSNRAD